MSFVDLVSLNGWFAKNCLFYDHKEMNETTNYKPKKAKQLTIYILFNEWFSSVFKESISKFKIEKIVLI